MSRNNQQHRQGQRPPASTQQPATPAVASPAPGAAAAPAGDGLFPLSHPAKLFTEHQPGEKREMVTAETLAEADAKAADSDLAQLGTELTQKADTAHQGAAQAESNAEVDAALDEQRQTVADAAQGIINGASAAKEAETVTAEYVAPVRPQGVIFHGVTVSQMVHGKNAVHAERFYPAGARLGRLANGTTDAHLAVLLTGTASALAVAQGKARDALEMATDPATVALLRDILDL